MERERVALISPCRTGFGRGFEIRSLPEFAREEDGTSLIEMMIAILVLAIGLVGSANLAALAIRSNTMSRRDSTSAALAEMVIGQISALPVGGGVTSVTITDCAANSATVSASGTSAEAARISPPAVRLILLRASLPYPPATP
jgi:competence protein ComGC